MSCFSSKLQMLYTSSFKIYNNLCSKLVTLPIIPAANTSFPSIFVSYLIQVTIIVISMFCIILTQMWDVIVYAVLFPQMNTILISPFFNAMYISSLVCNQEIKKMHVNFSDNFHVVLRLQILLLCDYRFI